MPKKLQLEFIESDTATVAILCNTALEHKLFRRNGQLKEWLITEGRIKYAVLVSHNNRFIACGVVNRHDELALYVRIKYRKKGIGSQIIQKCLDYQKGTLYGLPDIFQCYDYNGRFWQKIAKRNQRVILT